MKNANSTAPSAAPYSAPCCSRESCTAPRAVRIEDYSAPCCSQAYFEAVRTAPRAVLISITRRSPLSSAVLHRFSAPASPSCFTALKGHRTTLPTAKAGTAQTCCWHLWALPLAARSKPRAAACSNGLHRETENRPVCGTVPLSGLVGARLHFPSRALIAGHTKSGARARCNEQQRRTG